MGEWLPTSVHKVVWVTVAGVGPELTQVLCLWATTGACEGECVSACHQLASGWTDQKVGQVA